MELTPTGLVIDTVDEIFNDIATTLKTDISPALDTNPETAVLGQIVGIFAEREHQLQEIIRELYQGENPAGASGQALTQLALITGTLRRDAYPSTVALTVLLDDGVTLDVGSIAAVAGAADVQFETIEAVTNDLGYSSTFDVLAQSVVTGPIRANAGTITEIVTNVVGWTSVTNATDAQLGADDEADPALRTRRTQELRVQGSAALDAIIADVSRVDGVISVTGRENTSEVFDEIEPHSFEIVVWSGVVPGADYDDIAQAIWDAKPAGILSSGGLFGTAVDRQGVSREIGFSFADDVPIYLEINAVVDPDTLASGSAPLVRTAIVADTATRWRVGADVVPSALYAAVFSVSGIISVTSIGQSLGPSGYVTTILPIDFAEIAIADTSRIVVNFVDELGDPVVSE